MINSQIAGQFLQPVPQGPAAMAAPPIPVPQPSPILPGQPLPDKSGAPAGGGAPGGAPGQGGSNQGPGGEAIMKLIMQMFAGG